MLNGIIKFFLENRLVTWLIILGLIFWGLATAPFDYGLDWLPRDPVAVDAIPDLGENQQIIYSEWMGRSPQDVEDQVTYPLTTALLGIPGVKSIRSTSMFGFSSIYVIFEEDVEFYWSRSRILEKLNSLPAGLLPAEVKPTLGPDATALGQVFWYTLEGRDTAGKPTGGWDLHEIRTTQDFYVKYALNSVQGVAEVASIGGQVKQYQVVINPDAIKAYNISLSDVMMAVKNANRDAGAQTIEVNKMEYMVRGLGYIKGVEDLEEAVVMVNANVPIRIKHIAQVTLGPEARQGILDKGGAEVVGGVVVARFGSNPLEVIDQVKQKIKQISPGLPHTTLEDGRISQLTIVPFYDRSGLIYETLGTLQQALTDEIIVCIIVVLILLFDLGASLVISSLLPLTVLLTFIVMRYTGLDANIVALSGIAIAIGVMTDVGIVFVENIKRHLEMKKNALATLSDLNRIILEAAREVSGAITTAMATTLVSFLPVFAMESAEGKLFKPLAFTKTYALAAAFFLGLVALPTVARMIFAWHQRKTWNQRTWPLILTFTGLILTWRLETWLPIILVVLGLSKLLLQRTEIQRLWGQRVNVIFLVALGAYLMAESWVPLGHQNSMVVNVLFVVVLLILVLSLLWSVVYFYEEILSWCLRHKYTFLIIPVVIVWFGLTIWLGFGTTMGWISKSGDAIGLNVRATVLWSYFNHKFPGTGKEFMPSLDEGSFLLMPTSMPHSGVEENKRIVQQLDMLVSSIPEVELVVGKAGRAESALDPAPLSMFENVINYKSEYMVNSHGRRQTFKTDDQGRFILRQGDTLTQEEAVLQRLTYNDLIPQSAYEGGQYFRQWRSNIHSPEDIWTAIVEVTKLPGVTSAPKLQPIETRLVMLQTGMRAPMGIKVYGPDLKTIESFGLELEKILQGIPSVKKEAVFADRIVGKPYLHLRLNREALARYGMSIEEMQQFIEAAVGGMVLTYTVEGRQRFPVQVRYPRELRDDPERMRQMMVPTPVGIQVPFEELVQLEYLRGPQMIKSEETFLVGYVLFDKQDASAEVDVVESAEQSIRQRIESGTLIVPPGVSYKFSGNYENQIRATKRLSIVIPVSLLLILLLLYFQFQTLTASLIHFSGVFVAFAGGFMLLWLYGEPWFMDFSIAGVDMRNLFQLHTINLSVAVWVGFIALFGIATDDGVMMGTYIHQVFEERNPQTVQDVHAAVMEAGKKRVRPAIMTTAVSIVALLPVLTSTGKGADIMVPMAIPTFGGMTIQIITIFVVPVCQTIWREQVIKRKNNV